MSDHTETLAQRDARLNAWLAGVSPGDIVTVRLNSTDTLTGKVYEAPDDTQRTALYVYTTLLRHGNGYPGGSFEPVTEPVTDHTDTTLTDTERAQITDEWDDERRIATVESIVAARVAAARAERDAEWQRHLRILPDEMAEAWGLDAPWITTGNHVATLVGDWLSDLHYDLSPIGDRALIEGADQ